MPDENDVELGLQRLTGFEWDVAKSEANLTKHGLDFDEAAEVFYDRVALRRSDRNNEERWIAVGLSHGRIVSVIFTLRDDKIRIISARHPRPNEERDYRYAQMGRPEEGQD